MKEYHKIDSVYKRDIKGKFLLGQWSQPEFEYLADLSWQWTEKIDGTNIRIMWQGDPLDRRIRTVTFGGKTDNALIPTNLVNWLKEYITSESFYGACLEDDICLYGEGYGAGIQKGGGLYSAEQKFILFDIKIGHWWLKRDAIEDIAQKLALGVVPMVPYNPSLTEMIERVSSTGVGWMPVSSIGTAPVEGYVGTPLVPLFNRKGERIVTKVKYKDFM